MQSLMNGLINKSLADTLNITEDEYIENDIIYCKKCKTPRSLFIQNPITFENKLVRCICECQEAQRDAEVLKEEEERRLQEVKKLKDASLMGDKYREVRFENTELGNNATFDNAFNRCKRYCEVASRVLKEGMGIYLYGENTGTGKTHLTACMANNLLEQRYQVLFTNFSEISKMIRETFNTKESENEYINRLASIDFLFIDDIGTERVTRGDEDLWLQGIMYDVINKRYNNKKPTIFTSNHSLQELMNDRGIMKKTVDRIAEMATAIFKVEGDSYRLKKRSVANIPF